MLFTTLLTTAAFAAPALSHDTFSYSRMVERQAGQVLTTGANNLGDQQTHARLEINDLQQNRPDMWSLYIRTMTQWKEAPQDDVTGYFGISSIHGVPRTSWDGVEACSSCGGADGYCTHDSVLFPAWHRSYLALFEQEFIKAALQTANSFDGDFGRRMQAAAQKIRIPYWDWAATPDQGTTMLPASISSQQVTIEGPNGQETVDNPLYSYHFTDESGMFYSPFTSWPNTLRYPNTNNPSATSQESQAIAAFTSIQQNMQESIYNLLSQCNDYLGFATDDARNNACANSIEGIHNTIHTTSGGPGSPGVSGGHMTYLPLASFDPIFMIHHANVDRMFALWQTAHPDAYGASQQAPHNTWTIASGSTQDANSPLMPFRKAPNAYWTTNDVRDWDNTFKYTYPEFLVTDGSQAAINNMINNLYGPGAVQTASGVSSQAERDNSGNAQSGSAGRQRAVAPTSSTGSDGSATSTENPQGYGIDIGLGPISISLGFGGSKPYPTASVRTNGTHSLGGYKPSNKTVDPAFLAPNGSYYQYQCNVDTPRYAFNGSYVVYVFDGQPSSDDTTTWLADENCVGQLGILAGGEMENHGILSSGSVPVTRYLQKQVKAGKLPDMSEKYIVPYMKENLNWKIVYQGEEVHPSELKGYKASFFSGLLSPIKDGELPVLSNLLPHVDVTKGKAGGVSSLVEALGNTVGDVGGAIGGLLGGLGGDKNEGDAATPAGYGSPGKAVESPTPTSAPSSPSYPTTPAEETTTIYVTEYTTYCPCKTASSPEQSGPAYTKPEGY